MKLCKKAVSVFAGVLTVLALALVCSLTPLADGITMAEAAGATINATEVTLYGLDSDYEENLEIPSTLPQSFQLKVTGAQDVSYSVISGNSVTVDSTGLIKPRTTTWYWYGNIGSTKPDESKTPTRIDVSYTFGDSVVQIKTADQTFKVNVSVKDYAKIYTDNVIDKFISENITSSMTEYEKADAICEFVASYDYSPYYQSVEGMIINGGGDCWASTNTIIYLCDKVGIDAWARNGNRDPGAGSGHRNVMAVLDGEYYELEAGYYEPAPRYYSLIRRPCLYSMKYNSTYGGYEVYQYDGKERPVSHNIPSSINGKPIVGIGDSFLARDNVVETVTLPSTIKFIDNSAFYYCTSLKSINIPASVEKLGSRVFSKCNALTDISISSDNKFLCMENGAIYDKNKTTLICAPITVNLVIPSSVTTISSYAAAYNERLQSVVIPSSVKVIPDNAFASCPELTGVRLAEGLITIGDAAFSLSSKLSDVSIPNTVKEIGIYAFNDTALSGKLIIPDSVLSVGIGAFSGTDITSAIMGSGLSAIENYTFFNCSKLTEITLPANISSIGNNVFWRNDKITFLCYKDSFAHTYATENEIAFELITKPVTTGTPEGLKMVSHTANSITLGWETVEGVDGYVIEQLIDGKWQRVAKLYKQTNSRCTVTGLELGEYSFRIKAYAMVDGKGVFSTASEAISASTKLGKTEGEMSAYTTDSVTLSWVAVPGADGYIIEQYEGGGIWTQVAKITSGTTVKHKLTSLDAATVYKYRIKAYKVTGDKTIYGTGCSTITAVTKPGITTCKMTAHSASSVTLSWDKVAGANGYIIEQYEVGGVWTQVAKVTSGSTVAKTISGLESGTFYKYRIKAYRTVGDTTYIGTGSSTITAMTKPAKTVGSVVTTTTDSATLKWETVNGADGYVIEVYVGNGVWERAAKVTGGAKSQYRLTGLTSKTTYKYRIKAYKFLDTKAYFATGCDTITAVTK